MQNESQPKPECRFSGYQHVPGKKNCPAYGNQCQTCQTFSHIRACCNNKREESKRNKKCREKSTPSKRNHKSTAIPLRSYRQVNNLIEDKVQSSLEEEYVFSTSTVNAMSYQKLPQFKVKINGTPLTIMADTSASVDVLDEVSFDKQRIQSEIRKTNVKILPYGSDKPLTLVGKCQCEVETDSKFSVETYFIVEGNAGCLVSWKSSVKFK